MDRSVESSAIAESPRQRRKVRRYLLQPGLQLKLPGVILLLTLVYGLGFASLCYLAIESLYQTVLAPLDMSELVKQTLQERLYDLSYLIAWGAATFAIATAIVCVLYSHRMVGPTIAFRRHIAALKTGNYAPRICLRKGDAFTEVADDLNELAEALEHKHSPPE